MDVAPFDVPDRLDPAESGLGRSERPRALTGSKQPLHCRMVALDEVVAPLAVHVPDAVKMRIVALIDLAENDDA